VYRGNKKWGVISACLFYVCIMNNLTRTPKEITNIMSIEDRFLSQGDKILQELNELNIIEIPATFKPLGDYIDQFFCKLKIPLRFKDFILEIISVAERKYLHVANESRMTSKCIGCIYLLCKRVPMLQKIKKDRIVKECLDISKSTFNKYYMLIMSHPKELKFVFKKHHIPMPIEWRSIR
jgi:transcription initiation factor TFIIIB Brf1 subunit/transcription initiation factor TFIIB